MNDRAAHPPFTYRILSVFVTSNGQMALAVVQLNGLIMSNLVILPIQRRSEETLI